MPHETLQRQNAQSNLQRGEPCSTEATQLNAKTKETAETILNAFRSPERLPDRLAPIFIRRKDDIPCHSWSWMNQFLIALYGHTDARGYRQWQKVNRHVRPGEKAVHILSPIVRMIVDDESEEEKPVATGFRATPVFGYDQTDGEPLPRSEADAWLESLPLREVAAEWGISIAAFNGRANGSQGSFRPGRIALGVENLSTWCHELVHAADHRNGNLTEYGQHWRSETVAELGGAVLLKVLGHDSDADLGGCWQYIAAYAEQAGVHPLTACQRVLQRTCDSVSLILDTADQLA